MAFLQSHALLIYGATVTAACLIAAFVQKIADRCAERARIRRRLHWGNR